MSPPLHQWTAPGRSMNPPPVFVEELNTNQVDDHRLCVLDAVHEFLGLLGHGCHQDKSTEDRCPDQTLFNIELHSLRVMLHMF